MMEQIIANWSYESVVDDTQEWLKSLREYYQLLETTTGVKQPLLQVVQAAIARATKETK